MSMKLEGAPMLFAAPMPPIWVPRSRPLVLGRSSECDMFIPSRRASRRHAEVRFENEGVVIEDLSSTNGTRVNGEPLNGTRELHPGDRIEIGSITVTFCQVESRFSMSSESEDTMVLGAIRDKPGPESFRGDLAEIPVSVVLQILEGSGKSGVLRILTPEGAARVWVEEGRPVHADTDRASGFAAAAEICHLAAGRFAFERGAVATKRTLAGTMTGLLLEVSRVRDEDLRHATQR
jgi:pSer/pThr/pTyr-binding forkhead associated (FHA) protein